MPNIWDSRHQQITIINWKRSGLLCRDGETYKDIYYHVMSINNCQLCQIEFNKEKSNQVRCMDHDHNTGYFRKVLCRRCNNGFDRQISKNTKTGHMWITPNISKNRNGTYSVGFRYQRKGFKKKQLQSLTKLICLSFINLLKEPI